MNSCRWYVCFVFEIIKDRILVFVFKIIEYKDVIRKEFVFLERIWKKKFENFIL